MTCISSPDHTSACGQNHELRRVWDRAAVLGSLWASFEIVVGSFLHNLQIPLAGTVLTAVGVLILVTGERVWNDPRLLWRSALICALMKSISPSAIIFGPMIGIFMEGLLLWAAVRLLGSNLVGYCVGGAAAALWSLAQKIISLFLFYGSNIGALYLHAYRYAAHSLGISRFGAYDLLIVLAACQSMAGAAAACAAWKMGRSATAVNAKPLESLTSNTASDLFGSGATQRYSPLMLAATAALLGMGIWITSASPLPFAAIFVGAFVLAETLHYPKALRRLLRPKLWAEIAVILLLSGLVLGSLQHGSTGLGGLAIGAHMVLRAALVIVGFAALSIELRNPKILGFFGRKRLSNLSSALQSAVGVLPLFMAALSQRKQGWRRPFRTLAELMALAESLQSLTRPGCGRSPC